MTVQPLAPPVASPCVGVCEIDAPTGYCRGCGRTAEEVAVWREAPASLRDAVWPQLPGRLATLGVRIRRLSWGPSEILDFVEETLRANCGRWVLGVHGAAGEFLRDLDEPCAVQRDARQVEAVTARGALRLAVAPTTRALAREDGRGRAPRIVLALPRVRLPEPGPTELTALGPDVEAVGSADRDAPRFDIGLGRAAARFTIRVRSAALAERLAAAEGRPWPGHLAATGAAILAEGPVRVIETPLGRLEVDTPILPPDGPPRPGPRTQLLPSLVVQGLDVPPGMDLPEAYAAGAIFHPAP